MSGEDTDSKMNEMIARRVPIVDWLIGSYADVDGVIIGFGLVIEFVGKHGVRGVHRITSDGGGHPLPWHTVEGYCAALSDLDEFDDGEEDDE